eukprot:13325516-Alexandrium_andersonii.AAC.1
MVRDSTAPLAPSKQHAFFCGDRRRCLRIGAGLCLGIDCLVDFRPGVGGAALAVHVLHQLVQ